MLDGPQTELKTYMAVQGEGEHGDKSVTFQAFNKQEARELLDAEGLNDYRIVWESTPKTVHKELVKNESGEYELKTKQ